MNDEVITHLLMYLQNMIDSGQHKLFYNDLMHDEKVIDIINAITNLQEENERLNNIIDELEKWLKDEANFWKQQQEKAIKNGWLEFGGKYNTTIIYENAINKLKELKEGKELLKTLNGGDDK